MGFAGGQIRQMVDYVFFGAYDAVLEGEGGMIRVKLPVRRVLCSRCERKYTDGYRVERSIGIEATRYGKCEECGKKSIVSDCVIDKKKDAYLSVEF